MRLSVVGGGLAGSEAAWQAAQRGVDVTLLEMRPVRMSAAHETSFLGELVCSNSLGSNLPTTGGGLLKEELRRLGSIIMRCADANPVPAGRALAVDRSAFAQAVTEALLSHPRIRVLREEVTALPEGPCVIATGPLTEGSFGDALVQFTGEEQLYFYDAAAPIVTRESLDESIVFPGSRYEADEDYLNAPFERDEYESFWEALIGAETAPLHGADRLAVFEGCMPIEEIARRGRETLRYGPLKPVGLSDPRTGRRPYAVVQLRREDTDGSLLNLVGLQTRLKWGEQRRVFSMIPGFRDAEFVRYGVMHRNTFINAPAVLLPTYQAKKRADLFFAGQITGVEGYLESTASGLMAGVNAARLLHGEEPLVPPAETMVGGLAWFITSPRENVQPMNANYGILPALPGHLPRPEKRALLSERALRSLEDVVNCTKIAN